MQVALITYLAFNKIFFAAQQQQQQRQQRVYTHLSGILSAAIKFYIYHLQRAHSRRLGECVECKWQNTHTPPHTGAHTRRWRPR